MTAEEIIIDIKKELRANMNGIASKSMRDKGLNYRINFGIELPRLRNIAREFESNHQIAQQLWHEGVRESKILAGMLMPIDKFYPEIADIWVEDIDNPEIAQQTVMNLFARLPYASEKAFEWMAAENETKQLCGFLLIARLLNQGAQMNERAEREFLDQCEATLHTESLPLRKSILSALNHYIDHGNETARAQGEEILKKLY